MAYARFTHSCGHEGRVEGFNRRDADARAAGEAMHDCFACRCAAESEQARKQSADLGLPALRGTPKQIAYAETLRARKLPIIEKTIVNLRKMAEKEFSDASKRQEMIDAIAALAAELRQITSASEWIDARPENTYWMLKQIADRDLAPTMTARLRKIYH